jgi:hypothetical protein
MSQRLHTGLYDARRRRVGRFVDVTFTSALVGAPSPTPCVRGSPLFARHDTVDGVLETHMDPGPAFRVQEVEGHAFELVAVKSWTGMVATPSELSRFFSARGFLDTRIRLASYAQSSIASRTSLDLSPPSRFCGVCAVLLSTC